MSRLRVALTAVLLGSIGARADDEKTAIWEEVFRKEVQAAGQAWQYSGVDLPTGYSATITATGTWQINETWEKKVGPGGNSDFRAGDTYVKSGANEGCLLVRVGDAVRAFSEDDEVIRVTGPGKIYFCANDIATTEGLAKAELFVHGIPIQPAQGASGSGFQDNDGIIKVRVAVTKSKAAAGPKKRGEDK
jgi:hypothetical protein